MVLSCFNSLIHICSLIDRPKRTQIVGKSGALYRRTAKFYKRKKIVSDDKNENYKYDIIVNFFYNKFISIMESHRHEGTTDMFTFSSVTGVNHVVSCYL